MTTGKENDPESSLKQDTVVEKLVPDPAEPPKVKVLIGLLGRSSREGYWRLYVTAYLDEYFEFHGREVCHHERLDPNQSPLGGTIVWVRATAEILRTRSSPAVTAQEFLQGEIARALSTAAIASAPGFWGLRPGLGALSAGTCTLVWCTKVEACKISREENPCV